MYVGEQVNKNRTTTTSIKNAKQINKNMPTLHYSNKLNKHLSNNCLLIVIVYAKNVNRGITDKAIVVVYIKL